MPAVAFPTGVLMHPCTDLCSSRTLKIFLGNFTSQIVLYFDWVGRGVRLPPYIFRSVCTRSPLLRSDLEILRISFSLPFISHFRIRFSYIRNHTSIPFFWLEREFLFIAQCFPQRGFPLFFERYRRVREHRTTLKKNFLAHLILPPTHLHTREHF